MAERKKSLFDPPEEDSGLATGLLDFFFPVAEANQYNAPIDPNVWYAEYLHGKKADPNVAGRYKDVRAGGRPVMQRFDLTARLRPGMSDPVTQGLTNTQLYDPVTRTVNPSRIGVGRVGTLQGNIGFEVNPGRRETTRKGGTKSAHAGLTGNAAPRMTEAQINHIKKHGVEIQFNPRRMNAFITMDNKVPMPFNGYAVTEGNRAYIVDRNWGTSDIKYYTKENLPAELKSGIKKGDVKYNLRGGSGGAITKSPTSRIGGGPRRHKTIQEMLAEIVN